MILKLISKIAATLGIELQDQVVKLNLQPFILSAVDLGQLAQAILGNKIALKYNEDLSNSGFGEFALVGSELGWKAVNFGPGPGKMGHKIDEFVDLTSIDQVTSVYISLIKLLSQKS